MVYHYQNSEVRPDHANDAFYCCRSGKNCDVLNVQIIFDKCGRIRWLVGGVPGAAHDKTALELDQEFLEFPETKSLGLAELAETRNVCLSVCPYAP